MKKEGAVNFPPNALDKGYVEFYSNNRSLVEKYVVFTCFKFI